MKEEIAEEWIEEWIEEMIKGMIILRLIKEENQKEMINIMIISMDIGEK